MSELNLADGAFIRVQALSTALDLAKARLGQDIVMRAAEVVADACLFEHFLLTGESA